jgi:nicotinamide-nucleotide amidase
MSDHARGAPPGGTPRAEFLAIGSELLEPWRADTNGAWVALRLGELGIAVRFKTVVGDDPGDLEAAFRTALDRSDVVIATGGLGPTVDDLTREAVAAVLGLPMREDPAIVARLEERFRRHGLPMAPRNRRQAMILDGALVLDNQLGTAPGQLLRPGGRLLALLPGVPAEMKRMMEDGVLPRLPRTGRRHAYRVLKIAGLTESDVDRRLEEVARAAAPVVWTILGYPGQVEIHLRESVPEGGEPRALARLDAAIAAILGVDLFGRDEDTLEAVTGRLLLERRQTVAIAESLTGGRVTARLVNVPGASSWVRGGVVAYTDDAKRSLAGVGAEVLAARGAVSRETAVAMAEGIRARLGADWGVATTGYAGPEGGPDGRPPGTVILAIAGPAGTRAREWLLPGDRDLVRTRTAQMALDALRRAILETGS